MSEENKTLIPDGIRIPLYIDTAMFLVVLFGGATMWQQVQHLRAQVDEIRVAVQADRASGGEGRANTSERLARLETEVRMTREDVAEIKDLLRERR
jgi:hypothetical protein